MQPIMKARYFEGYMQRAFRGWEDSGTVLDKVWTGSKYHQRPNRPARPLPIGIGANPGFCYTVQAVTPDGVPHAGVVPDQPGALILAGFNGGGNALIFLLAKGIAQMLLTGIAFEDIDPIVPRTFKTTEKRMAAQE